MLWNMHLLSQTISLLVMAKGLVTNRTSASGAFFPSRNQINSWFSCLHMMPPVPRHTSCPLSYETKDLGKGTSLGNLKQVAMFSCHSTGRIRELKRLWSKSATWNVILENNTGWKNIFLKKALDYLDQKLSFAPHRKSVLCSSWQTGGGRIHRTSQICPHQEHF